MAPSFDELTFATGRANAVAATSIPAAAVPSNYKRPIWRFRMVNATPPVATARYGTNVVRVQRHTAGVGTTVLDMIPFTTWNEEKEWPNELKENSLPAWVFNASQDSSFVATRGTVFVHLEYSEAP